MKDGIRAFFEEEKIEYAEALSYADAREISPHILARAALTPRSMILFLLPYYAGETENLSIYAAARDYHIAIREVTERLIRRLDALFPGSHSVGFGDHSPIDERHAALSAGLGILGKNGLLIHPVYGTYVFIADILTDIPPEALGAIPAAPPRFCEGCGACLRACPTGILRGEGDTCLSAVTQRKGDLTAEEIGMMKKYHTVWGCDICQSVCPHNRSPRHTPLPFFREERIPHLTRKILDDMGEDAFRERAFAWRGRRVVERNLDAYESKNDN